MSQLTIEQKIGQLFFIGIAGPELDPATRKLIDTIQPGGVCLFARNIRERRQTRDLLDGLREALPITPLLSVDQEGGLVDRLRRVMTPMPAANTLRCADDAAKLGGIIGESLRILGFNMDFAPVVDVMDDERAKFSNGLHSRAFGKSKEDVVAFSTAFLNSLQEAGIIGCLKHFPGLGASQVDSHKELPTVSTSETQFSDVDLYPYKHLLRSGAVHAVMIAHAAFPNVRLQEKDQNGKLLPSSLSPAIISTLLRSELGFDGLAITDDLEMGAIVENYDIGDACRLALEAGADMLAICASSERIERGFSSLVDAVANRKLEEATIDRSIDRIDAVRDSLQPPRAFDDKRIDELSDDIIRLNEQLN